ncbi:hypothetical protein HY640_02655 [Candidatus Woesearchaeota archaeon]|nr:hypothetical protein [Candidatus Woesearchaeota archaeon]
MKEAGTSVRAIRVLLVLAVLLIVVPSVLSETILERSLNRLGVDKNQFDVQKIYDNYQPFLDFVAYAILFIGVSMMGLKKTFGESTVVPVVVGMVLAVAAAFYASTIKFKLGDELGPTALLIGVGLVGFMVFNVFKGMNVDGFHSAAWGIVIAGALIVPVAEKAMAGVPQDSLLRTILDWAYVILTIATLVLIVGLFRSVFGMWRGSTQATQSTAATSAASNTPWPSHTPMSPMGATGASGTPPTGTGGGSGPTGKPPNFDPFKKAHKNADTMAKSMEKRLVHNINDKHLKNIVTALSAVPARNTDASKSAEKAINELKEINRDLDWVKKYVSVMDAALGSAFRSSSSGKASIVAKGLLEINQQIIFMDLAISKLSAQLGDMKTAPAATKVSPTDTTIKACIGHVKVILVELSRIEVQISAGP